MSSDRPNTSHAREIVALLPKRNCGKCGYENCGQFALAAIAGSASPFGCRRDRAAGHEISRILGKEAPARIGASVETRRRRHGGMVRHGHEPCRHRQYFWAAMMLALAIAGLRWMT